jgi:hypothetical protein
MILAPIAKCRQLQQLGGVSDAIDGDVFVGGHAHGPILAGAQNDKMAQDEALERITHAFISKLRHNMAERCRHLPATPQQAELEHPVSLAVRNNDLVDGMSIWLGGVRGPDLASQLASCHWADQATPSQPQPASQPASQPALKCPALGRRPHDHGPELYAPGGGAQERRECRLTSAEGQPDL